MSDDEKTRRLGTVLFGWSEYNCTVNMNPHHGKAAFAPFRAPNDFIATLRVAKDLGMEPMLGVQDGTGHWQGMAKGSHGICVAIHPTEPMRAMCDALVLALGGTL